MTEPINRRNSFSFFRTNEYNSRFQDNFDFRSELNLGRFSSFYEISLGSSSVPPSRIVHEVNETTDQSHTQTTVERINDIPRETHIQHGERQGGLDSEPIPPRIVRVVEFGGIEWAKDILGDPQLQNFSNLMRQMHGRHADQFTFGIFLAAEEILNDPQSENAVLLVQFPYLGLTRASGSGAPVRDDESWGLSQYIKSKGVDIGNLGLSRHISVHQALFASCNEDFVIIARSKEVGNLTRNIFPQQDRVGAFHLLINMIAETLRVDDRKILKLLRSKATQYDFEHSINPEALRQDLTLMKASKLVIDHQIEILKDMKDMFLRAGPDHITPSVYSSKYNTSMMRIPILSGNVERTDEQLHYVVASLGKTIEEREAFNEELSGFIKKIDKNRDGKSADDLKSTLDTKLEEQKTQTQALQDEIASQGKTISIFTVLNVVFLPLGFFTQYFQGSRQRDGAISGSLSLFWAVAAPITGVIVFVAFFYYSKSNYNWRQYVRLVQDLFIWKGDRRPHLLQTKSDIQDQKSYLRRLPKYRIKAINQSYAQHIYLVRPSFSGSNLILNFAETSQENQSDIFCFDKDNGWLLYPEVDIYNHMYRAHVESVFPHNAEKMKVSWKRSPMVTEEAPYWFMGRFRAKKARGEGKFREMELEWEFSGRDGRDGRDGREGRSAMRRWDTKKTKPAGDFKLNLRNIGHSNGSNRWDVWKNFSRNRQSAASKDSNAPAMFELLVMNPWTTTTSPTSTASTPNPPTTTGSILTPPAATLTQPVPSGSIPTPPAAPGSTPTSPAVPLIPPATTPPPLSTVTGSIPNLVAAIIPPLATTATHNALGTTPTPPTGSGLISTPPTTTPTSPVLSGSTPIPPASTGTPPIPLAIIGPTPTTAAATGSTPTPPATTGLAQTSPAAIAMPNLLATAPTPPAGLGSTSPPPAIAGSTPTGVLPQNLTYKLLMVPVYPGTEDE